MGPSQWAILLPSLHTLLGPYTALINARCNVHVAQFPTYSAYSPIRLSIVVHTYALVIALPFSDNSQCPR